MFKTYKTNREPKNANSLAHAILTDQGFKLVSFQRTGHELGSFNYSTVVNGLPIHVSVSEGCAASPRATISLTLAAKAYAFLKGRGYVTPQDVKSIGMDVLRHRVAITYEAEAENKTSETIIQKIFDELPVP